MAVSVRTIYEQRKRTRLKVKIAALALLVAGTAGGFAYLNWWKRTFEFTEVTITGAPSLSREELLGNTGPISFFSSVAVAHPSVAAADIQKDYVHRTLRIAVRERERFGVWCAASCFWFDQEGVLFSAAPRAEGALVRIVDDRTGRELLLGARALEAERLRYVVRAFETLERAGLFAKSIVIEDLGKEEAHADLLLGPRVIFSLRNDPSFAYEPLASLASEMGKLVYIDLRTDQRIFLKYR